MCISFAFVYPAPLLYRCTSGFSESVVSDWVSDAISKGFVEVDDAQSVYERLSQKDFSDLDGIRWNSDVSGADDFYQRLWQNDEDYGAKHVICEDKEKVRLVETKSSSFWTDIAGFTPWVNEGECASSEMDLDHPKWVGLTAAPQSATTTTASPVLNTSTAYVPEHPLLIASVLVGFMLKLLLQF